MNKNNIEIWSCDPASIPEWTEEDKQRLNETLTDIFSWSSPQTTPEKVKEAS